MSTEHALELADFELERQALVYCIGQWLTTYKTKIVYAWIDRYFHAGTRTTSRLEGGHHILKNWIGGPTGDLTRAWESTLLTIDIELIQISQKRSRELQSIPTALSNQFYYGLHHKITHYGLYKLKEQYDLFRRYSDNPNHDSNTLCTGNFYSSFGLPCWHIIRTKISNKEIIQPLDFHPFYHYYKPPPGAEPIVFEPPILDPVSRQQRRAFETERRAHARQNQRLRTAQTGRILSQFEQAIQRLRHCSACLIHGHDRATCQGCRSTGHTRSNCPFTTANIQSNILQIQQYQGQNWEVENSLYGYQSQIEEVIPATQYSTSLLYQFN